MKKTQNNYKTITNNFNHMLKNGSFGIKINSFKRYSSKNKAHINFTIAKKLKQLMYNKKIKVWLNLNLNLNLTKLNTESRMGKGKGNIHENAVFLKPGDVLYEFSDFSNFEKLKFIKYLKKKLPFKFKYVNKFNN